MIAYFQENSSGEDYVVGDIHGCFSKLQKFLDRINFNPEKDRLFSVGDLVDRGPESNLVLDWLEKDWFIPVRGNHDEMAVTYQLQEGNFAQNDAVERDYRLAGGDWNIDASYEFTQRVGWHFSHLPMAVEYQSSHGTLVFVHADIPSGGWEAAKRVLEGPQHLPAYYEMCQNLMWCRERVYGFRTDYHEDISYAVVGHTPLPEACTLENTIYLDTGACFEDGFFTLLRLRDMMLIKEPK